jgi:hypothetical protein
MFADASVLASPVVARTKSAAAFPLLDMLAAI